MAHQLVEDVFGVKEAFLSNESTLDDFFVETDVPGHKLISISKVPKLERNKYKLPRFLSGPDKFLVWYPPLTTKETDFINTVTRKLLLKQVEKTYGISLEDYPENKPLYVWKVAKFVASRLRSD